MKNKSNNNISQESEETDDINLLLNDFRTALKKEYIIPIINKMIYIIQYNTFDSINELNFNHHHSLIKVGKIHDEFEYLKFIQQNINPYVTLFNKLTYKEMKIFCLNQILKISSQNI